MLDKGHATLAGINGEYRFACPLDQHVLEFAGIDADARKAELAAGKSDGEILAWMRASQSHKRSAMEIAVWSAFQDQRTPGHCGTREFFNVLHKAAGSDRDDIITWPDLLDLDDYVSFGGKP